MVGHLTLVVESKPFMRFQHFAVLLSMALFLQEQYSRARLLVIPILVVEKACFGDGIL